MTKGIDGNITAHGGNIVVVAGKLGCRPPDILDMSSNLSPLGTAPGLQDFLITRLAEIGYLPEPDSLTLRELFARQYGLGSEQVLAGNGTTEFIYAVPTVTGLNRAVIVNPTYADYYVACTWAGLKPESFNLRPAEDFRLDLQRLARTIRGGELVFICNPNNPTSVLTPNDEILRFAERHQDSIFLVDESYLPFTREPSLLRRTMPENLVVLLSFSKIYGIPGLRLGFLAASTRFIARLKERVKPWGVNRLAQIAGEYLLQSSDQYVADVVSYLEKYRPAFTAELTALPDVQVFPAAANFILCRLAGNIRAARLREKLLEYRIMARNCENFAGLDDRFFRLSLKDEKSNNFCMSALRKILNNQQAAL